MKTKIAVVGLGYVGLPLALAFARKFEGTVGFDINQEKVARLRRGEDVTDEGLEPELKSTTLKVTSQLEEMRGANFFVVGVPTPVDDNKKPDLSPLHSACECVGKVLSRGATVCFESTVYPGVTEDYCGPLLEKVSGLKQSVDFKLAYSPERINPGDKERTLVKILKVVSGEDQQTLEHVAQVYGAVIEAGVYRAQSIKVAEAAKVIENTQRDLNIALMNELAIIFDRMGISTKEVLDAAASKWNFVRFAPGLVGGHCIGVDPYYLTAKAEQLGYNPQVILAGRRINDSMGSFIAERCVKLMINAGIMIAGAKVGILGITFKENVTDIRNSRVPDIVKELKEFGIEPLVHDAYGNSRETEHEYGISLTTLDEFRELDAVILAVPHNAYREMGEAHIAGLVREGGVFIDVKAALDRSKLGKQVVYWAL